MTTVSLAASLARGRSLFPGVLACAVLSTAATFLSQQYGGPVMLLALLLGMAMNFLSAEGTCGPGIAFTARTVLRIGVALLGLRITAAQIAALGWHPILLVVVSVAVTITVAMIAARLLGFRGRFGLLTGGATAICGASAALALSASLPSHPLKERATLFTIVGVSCLSTVAMVLYPVLARALGLDAQQAGIFLGATIHDVAQVVGAGYSMSHETGDVATVIKLMRVATLLPVIVFAAGVTRLQGEASGGKRPPLLPGFAVAFVGFVALNSAGFLPATVVSLGNDVSRWCLVAAVAAIGMKTSLRDLAEVGLKPIMLMLGETTFLAVLVLLMMHWTS
jgi:uncharacterized integral membrane protein (TIGR00698 family)